MRRAIQYNCVASVSRGVRSERATHKAERRILRRLRVDGSTQSDLGRLAGGTMPFMRRYSTICP
jgi:hypothetical protein